MNNTERAQRLNQAAELIAEVADTLDIKVDQPCDCCGMKKARNWGEKKIHDELAPMVARLKGRANQLAHGETPSTKPL